MGGDGDQRWEQLGINAPGPPLLYLPGGPSFAGEVGPCHSLPAQQVLEGLWQQGGASSEKGLGGKGPPQAMDLPYLLSSGTGRGKWWAELGRPEQAEVGGTWWSASGEG